MIRPELGPEIALFRSHYDVMLGPKAMKAHLMSSPECQSYNMKAWALANWAGIWVEITRNGRNEAHFVPMTNIEAICISYNWELDADKEEPQEIKRGPGRPKSQAV